MFIDFHGHFLHGIDDGADDLNTGFCMLRDSFRQGCEYVVATPHFNPGEATVLDEAIAEITECARIHGADIPEIIPAFEVDFSSGLKNVLSADKLCISGTSYMLVEMPYGKWSQNDIERLYELTLAGIRPVVAHIDRYFRHFGDSVFSIFELDICFQLNCKSMDTISGRTCVMGSDMHNMTSRPCNMKKAYNTACKKLAPYAEELFYTNAWNMIFSK